jgi:hypothetical protein
MALRKSSPPLPKAQDKVPETKGRVFRNSRRNFHKKKEASRNLLTKKRKRKLHFIEKKIRKMFVEINLFRTFATEIQQKTPS